MKKLSFKFKLISLCLFLCVIGATIATISYLGTLKLEHIQADLTQDIIPRSELLSKMDVA